MILIDSLKGQWIPLDILLISNLWGSLECIQDVREQWHKHVICANLITQLLKLPTQRPSSLPWGPRSGPIEHLNIFYFISPAQIRCTVFSTYSTSTAGEDGLYCPLQIRHLVLDLDYTYFQEVFLPLLYEQISGRKRMIYFVDKRFVEKEIWNIKKCILLNVGCDSNTFWWIQKVSN